MSIGDLLQIVGGAFGLAGSLMMANTYLNVPLVEKILTLVAALWRGSYAGQVAGLKSLTVEGPERSLVALQGLAFIALGFLFQSVGVIVTALSKA